MTTYGILKNTTNTGLDSELSAVFAAPLKISSKQNVLVSDSLNLKRHTGNTGAQRWEIETSIVPSQRNGELFAKLVIASFAETVYVRFPQIVGCEMDNSQTIQLLVPALPGADTIHLSGVSGSIPVGHFIQFTNHNKVYTVTDGGSSVGDVKIFPKLKQAVTNGTQIRYGDKISSKFFIDSNNLIGLSFTDGLLSDIGTLKLIEDV